MSRILIALIAVAAAGWGQPRNASEMEPLLAKIATFENGQSRAQLAQFTVFVQDSMGSPALLKEIEARLLRFVQSNTTPAGRDFALRQLSLIGTDASVPVLSGMLAKDDTAEMARYALARIPGAAASDALRKALEGSSGKTKIGIIDSLGDRGDTRSVAALRTLASSSDTATADAAIYALGKIAGRQAMDALAGVRTKVPAPLQQHASEAYLECADHLAAGGDQATAAKAYQQLLGPREPEMIRIAALTGLAGASGRNAAPALTLEVGSASPRVQAAAIRLLNGISGPQITSAMTGVYPKLQPAGQARLLAALADRGDASARPLLVQAARSDAPEVRAAALEGLGELGDASSVNLLAEAAASGQPAEQRAARASLSGLRGAGIDSAIVSAIGSSSGKVKAELILATGERGMTNASAVLIGAAREQDPDVRRNALRALRNVAGSGQVPALLEIVKTADSADRTDATQALSSALKRSQPAPIGAVVSAYRATPAVEARVSLIDALGQTSSGEALPLLRECLGDANPDISRAAILALTSWQDPAPLPDLLAKAKGGSEPALQVLALRGYIKLVGLRTERSNAESARLLRDAMSLASQPAEKRAVLALLPTYPCEESLKLAQEAAADQSVAPEAKSAANRIGNALKNR